MDLTIPIMPLNAVLFPGMPMPLFIFEDRYREMISRCQEEDTGFGIALIREGPEVGGPAVPHPVGTLAGIVSVEEIAGASLNVMAVGQRRFRLSRLVEGEAYLQGEVELLTEHVQERPSSDLHQELRELFSDYLQLILQLMGQTDTEIALPDDALRLSYMVAAHLTSPLPVRQKLLEMDRVSERLFFERQLLLKETSDYRLILSARRKYDELMGDRLEDDVFSVN